MRPMRPKLLLETSDFRAILTISGNVTIERRERDGLGGTRWTLATQLLSSHDRDILIIRLFRDGRRPEAKA